MCATSSNDKSIETCTKPKTSHAESLVGQGTSGMWAEARALMLAWLALKEGRDVALKPAGSASRRHTSSKASAELELLASGRAALRFIWEHDGSR